jgi:GT2 family glycosyltransferase
VVRVDGHCVIAPDYVSRCVDWLMKSDPDVACVGGAIETIGETPVSQGIAYAMSSRFGVGGSTFRVGANEPTLVDTVPFPAFRKSALTRAGDFDEDLVRNQDDEYSYRLRGLGYRILLIPEIRSTYYSRGSLRRLWSQYYQYGYWKVRVMHKHPRQMSPRQLIPPLFVLGVIGGALISLFTPVIFMMYLLVLALYGVLNLAVSVTLARQHGTHYLRVLPPAFLILHLSYGIGFWVGIIAWARKRL